MCSGIGCLIKSLNQSIIKYIHNIIMHSSSVQTNSHVHIMCKGYSILY